MAPGQSSVTLHGLEYRTALWWNPDMLAESTMWLPLHNMVAHRDCYAHPQYANTGLGVH